MYMNAENNDNEGVIEFMHIDYDKKEKIFYNNIYFKSCDMVLKIPISREKGPFSKHRIKIEKFNLTKYVYLIHY